MIPVNEYQTKITEELLNSLNDEVRTEFLDTINNIQFIQNLISPDRKRAKDLPRDNQGRIIVDICNPHILEDMDYFRPSAIHYQKYGKYTNLRPNGNPNSEYYKWINEEKRRCWYGMVRESDGEWIPGYYYFYLNYQPIVQTKVRKGTNQGDRVIDFPLVWEGNYLAFHYLDQARNGGKYNDFKGGNHCVEIAKRGASKAHPLDTIVPTASGFKKWEDIKIGDSLLTPDGDTTKVIDQTFFYNSSIYKVLLDNGSSVSCTRSHLFEIYVDGKKELKSLEEIIEIVTNQTDVICELAIPKATYFSYKPVKVDSYIIGFLLCSPRVYKSVKLRKELQSINFRHNAFPKDYLFNSINNRRKLFQGLIDSKGYVENGLVKIKLTNKKVTKQVNLLIRSLGYNTEVNYENKDCLISIFTDNKLFIDDATNELINCPDKRKINFTKITGIEFIGKRPSKCVTIDKNDGLYLVGDFIVTHNSYSLSSMMARNFILGENGQSRNKVRSVITAFEKEALTKDATLNKFVEVIDFCANNTEFPRQRLRDSISDMNWIMGYKDSEGLNKGTLNEVQGVSTNFNPDKARGKRANLFGYEEFGKFPKFIDTWTVNKPSIEEDGVVFGLGFAIGTGGCVCAGTSVFNNNGEIINIENIDNTKGIIGFNIKDNIYSNENISYIQKPNSKECVRLTTNSLRTLECSIDHPIYSSTKCDSNGLRVFNWNNSGELKLGDNIAIIREIPIFGNIKIFDARLIGLLIGDGSYISSPRITSCDKEIQDYLIKNYSTTIYANKGLTKDNKLLLEIGIKNIRNELRQLGIYGQSKNNKRLPNDIFKASKKDVCDLIAGLFDTDGCISIKTNHKRPNTSKSAELKLTSSCKELLEQVRLLLIKLGIYSNIIYNKPRLYKRSKIKDVDGWFNLLISDKISIINFYTNIKLLVQYKQAKLYEAYNIVKNKKSLRKNDNIIYEKIINIENLGLRPIYNLTADNTHTYIANGIITHNTSGSDFSGALEIIYNPVGHNVYALPNVYDKNSQGKQKTVFFFGAYLNRKGFYDDNGVSDVVGALISILNARHKVKYNTSDPTIITRVKAENPITIQDAIMKIEGSSYPIAELNDRLNEIDLNPRSLDGVYTGIMSQLNGEIIFKPDFNAIPVREFPHKNNKLLGCVEIHEMPEKSSSGKVLDGRYIAGIDPYDDDESDTLSLGSIFVLDLFTDRIVCEYTGRPDFADDFYEICRKIVLFYNAETNYENNKKGLYKYFSQHNILYLLSGNLDYLRDKEGPTNTLRGNKSKGTLSSAPIKSYGRQCIRDWLIKPKEYINEDNETVTYTNLQKMNTRGLIKELILWNTNGNFDRHDAFLMLMLLREEKLRLFGTDSPQNSLIENESEYLGNDDFFKVNYRN